MEAPHFRSLHNIETSFKMIRTVMFAVILGTLLLASGIAWWAFDITEKSRSRVYVMENGKSIMLALAQDHNVNRSAEAKDHVRTFLRLFFDLEPDDQQIRKTIEEASYLGDESVVRLHKDFTEKGYYSDLVQGNVHQKIEIDPELIQVNMTQSPYYFRAKGKELLVRESTVTYRNLDVEGFLIDVQRTDRNPHGFMIERFHPLDNSDIQTITRNQ